jgi:formyltetrahydrofolate-dependent phosphoribosylglycinamide formyltransferase
MKTGRSIPRLVVMISGSGTNLQAIIDAIDAEQLSAKIVLVVSNRENAFGLKRAQQANIPTLYFPFKPYKDQVRDVYDAALAEQIATYQPDLIVLAGWMHILTSTFLHNFEGKIINLHPALPGAFPGKDAIERAFDAYQQGQITHSGVMIHQVIPEVDAGAVIVQEIVPFLAGDTLETFSARMHETEHRLIVKAVQLTLEKAD